MFGSSIPASKDDEATVDSGAPSDTRNSPSPTAQEASASEEKNRSLSPAGRKSGDEGQAASVEKKRRSSGVSKAKDIIASAKNSFHLHGAGSPTQASAEKGAQSPIQKLGRIDPALSVPQGSLNNSAGESQPGPRSTFRVGVTEDKNKKCRRTMEDTHAYLYNFLSTPAPVLGDKNGGTGDSPPSDGQAQHIVETDNGYFAIFDGHAGTFAADWCGKKLHLLLEDIIRKNPNTPIPELLDQTFTLVDQQLEKLPLKNSGCTAVIAVLRWEDRIPNPHSATGSAAIAPAAAAAAAKASIESGSEAPAPAQPVSSQANQDSSSTAQPLDAQAEAKLRESATRQRVLYTANVGDARIVLCRNGRALRLSYDHKGSDENEGRRVANAGGLILNNRVNGVLAVTRALGDAYMKDLVTGHPYTTETVVQPDQDEFLILACDGLWDVCTDQEAVDLVRHAQDPQVASKMLVDHALARFSTDNLSCMIVRFDNKALKARKNESAIGVEGDPPTRQPGGVTEAEALVAHAKKNMNDSDLDMEPRNVDSIAEEEDAEAEPGPGIELNAAALPQRKV